jgi:hypothetical protein
MIRAKVWVLGLSAAALFIAPASTRSNYSDRIVPAPAQKPAPETPPAPQTPPVKPALQVPPGALQVPWKVGERLSFDIVFGLLDAGDATLAIEPVEEVPGLTPKVAAYHFSATARSTPFVDVFYKVRDRNDSWMDRDRWVSHRFEQHNQEGKYVLEQIVEFDWKKMRFKNVEKVQGRDPKYEEGALTIPALDTLSVLYAARAKPFKVGDEFSLDVHSGRDWPVSVKILKRETIKVPAGKFDCYLVEPYLRERGLFIQKGKKLQVWMTADERRIPVKMKAEIFIGSVSAELTRIDGY